MVPYFCQLLSSYFCLITEIVTLIHEVFILSLSHWEICTLMVLCYLESNRPLCSLYCEFKYDCCSSITTLNLPSCARSHIIRREPVKSQNYNTIKSKEKKTISWRKPILRFMVSKLDRHLSAESEWRFT